VVNTNLPVRVLSAQAYQDVPYLPTNQISQAILELGFTFAITVNDHNTFKMLGFQIFI
jgi:hypothetical protein